MAPVTLGLPLALPIHAIIMLVLTGHFSFDYHSPDQLKFQMLRSDTGAGDGDEEAPGQKTPLQNGRDATMKKNCLFIYFYSNSKYLRHVVSQRKFNYQQMGNITNLPLWPWSTDFFNVVVSIEFSPLWSAALTNSWYRLHNGDYTVI